MRAAGLLGDDSLVGRGLAAASLPLDDGGDGVAAVDFVTVCLDGFDPDGTAAFPLTALSRRDAAPLPDVVDEGVRWVDGGRAGEGLATVTSAAAEVVDDARFEVAEGLDGVADDGLRRGTGGMDERDGDAEEPPPPHRGCDDDDEPGVADEGRRRVFASAGDAEALLLLLLLRSMPDAVDDDLRSAADDLARGGPPSLAPSLPEPLNEPRRGRDTEELGVADAGRRTRFGDASLSAASPLELFRRDPDDMFGVADMGRRGVADGGRGDDGDPQLLRVSNLTKSLRDPRRLNLESRPRLAASFFRRASSSSFSSSRADLRLASDSALTRASPNLLSVSRDASRVAVLRRRSRSASTCFFFANGKQVTVGCRVVS